jgi:hypothetical protein
VGRRNRNTHHSSMMLFWNIPAPSAGSKEGKAVATEPSTCSVKAPSCRSLKVEQTMT